MFKDSFSFEGRIRRTEYGVSFIIYVVVAGIVNAIIKTSDDAAILMLVYIPLLWFMWAQGAKRCHDVGNSGWWQLIPFYVFWLLFEDGQPGPNQYGDNPKGIPSNNQANYSQTSANIPGNGYQGGYNGGHNNINHNNSHNANQLNSGEYQSGDLYR